MLMDLQHGILMFFIGCSITIIGFFIAYTIAMNAHNKLHQSKKIIKGPLDDLNKNMPRKYEKYGDDCQ